MKKRILTGLLAVVLVLATACGKDTAGGAANANLTAYERLTLANQSYEEVNSLVMDYVLDIDMAYEGESLLSYAMSGEMALNGEDESNIQLSMTAANQVGFMGMDESMDMVVYYLDGYYYVEMEGEKLCAPMSVEEAVDQAAPVSNVEFDESAIISQSISGDELTFVLDGAALTDFFNDSVGDMMSSMGTSDAALRYDDVTYVVRLDKGGNLESIRMDCSMEVSTMGESVVATVSMLMNIKQTGSGVTVVFPDDLDSYTEVSPSALGL